MTGTGAQEGNANVPESPPPVILHISDLHFSQADDLDDKKHRATLFKRLVDVVASQEFGWQPSIVCVSGDIGGRKEGGAPDYEAARKWLIKLLDGLGISTERLVLCPGNHDADRQVVSNRLKELEEEVEDKDKPTFREAMFRNGIPNALRPAFSEYEVFCDRLGVPRADFDETPEYLSGTRKIGDITFLILNSAWFTSSNDDRGKLQLGLELVRIPSLPNVHDGREHPITVAVFHHPLDFLCEDDNHTRSERPSTTACLSDICHMILTGHSHGIPEDPDYLLMRCLYFVAGSAYSASSHRHNFSLIQVLPRVCNIKKYGTDPSASTPAWRQEGEIKKWGYRKLPETPEPFPTSQDASLKTAIKKRDLNQRPVSGDEESPKDPADELRCYTEGITTCIERLELRDASMLAAQALAWLGHRADERVIESDIRKDFRCAAAEAQTAWALERRSKGYADWQRLLEEAKHTLKGIGDGT